MRLKALANIPKTSVSSMLTQPKRPPGAFTISWLATVLIDLLRLSDKQGSFHRIANWKYNRTLITKDERH